MWLKEKVVRERPEVHFQHQALIIAEGATPADTYMYSTSPRLNEMFGSRLRAASLRVREDDADFDGRPEALHVHLTLPLNVDEEVRGITMFVALEYNLQDHARFSHNATAIVRHAAGAPGTSLQLISDLELRTASAIPQFATDLPIPQGPPVLVGAALEDHLSALSPAALISRCVAARRVRRGCGAARARLERTRASALAPTCRRRAQVHELPRRRAATPRLPGLGAGRRALDVHGQRDDAHAAGAGARAAGRA